MNSPNKAILITEQNKGSLISQYETAEDYFDEYVGCYIVAAFGFGKAYGGIFDAESFAQQWEKTGETLKNDWFGVQFRQ